jgi:DnaJ-class molecular chaperone
MIPASRYSAFDSMEIKMSNDTEECKACFGAGNEARMHTPDCQGTGKAPAAPTEPLKSGRGRRLGAGP